MNQQYHFKVMYEKLHDGSFRAWVPSLPACQASGSTLIQAQARIQEAIRDHGRGGAAEGDAPISLHRKSLREVPQPRGRPCREGRGDRIGTDRQEVRVFDTLGLHHLAPAPGLHEDDGDV